MRALALAFGTFCLLAGEAHAVCQVDGEAVQFGSINRLDLTESTGRVTVTCDEATTFEVAITASGSGTSRTMLGPNNATLNYFLYSKPDRTTLWADGSAAGATVSGTSDGSTSVDLTVYGLVPQQPDLVAGSYVDSLTLLLTF